MNTPSEREFARQIAELCQDQRIDVTLTALAEVLARTIVAHDCEPDAALDIVVRFTHEWLARGGLHVRLVVRQGEPDNHEPGLEEMP